MLLTRARPPGALNDKAAGFSLIELILVVLIISVLTGLCIPVFRNTFLNMQFEQACLRLEATLDYARQAAVFKRIEQRVNFDTENRRLRVLPAGKVYVLPEGITIKADAKQLTFYPDGNSGEVNITIENGRRNCFWTTEGNWGYVTKKQASAE